MASTGLLGRTYVSYIHWVPHREIAETAVGESVGRKQEDGRMGTAIVVTLLLLLAIGIVTDQLFRLRKWLNRPPDREEPPDTD
jgi:cytochrome b